jgi:hypothetical protein
MCSVPTQLFAASASASAQCARERACVCVCACKRVGLWLHARMPACPRRPPLPPHHHSRHHAVPELSVASASQQAGHERCHGCVNVWATSRGNIKAVGQEESVEGGEQSGGEAGVLTAVLVCGRG